MSTDVTRQPTVAPPSDPSERLRQLAERQGTLHTSTYERLLGAAEHLWASDAELEAFVKAVEAGRREPE